MSTKFVLAGARTPDLQRYMENPTYPDILSMDWLLECRAQGRLILPAPPRFYLHMSTVVSAREVTSRRCIE